MFRIGSIIFFILIFSYTLFSSAKLATTFTPDFSIFYHAAKDVLAYNSPYLDKTLFTAFNYPLATALFFIPLTLLPYQIAQTFFLALNIVSVFVSTYFCFKILKRDFSFATFLLIVSLAFFAFPTKFTLGMGQTNLLAYCFLLAGVYFSQKKNSASFVFFVIALLLKPILAFTLVAFVFKKSWKELFIILFCSVGLVVFVPLVFNQPHANSQILSMLLRESLEGREVYYNQGVLGFISRFTPNLSTREWLNYVATGFFCIVTFLVIIKRKVTRSEIFSLLFNLLIIIDPLSWQHHFVFLLLPFISTFFLMQSQRKKFYWYILFAGSYVFVAGNIKNPEVFVHFPKNLLLSQQFYGACLLLLLQIFLILKQKRQYE